MVCYCWLVEIIEMIYIVSLVYDDVVDEVDLWWNVFMVNSLFDNWVVVLVGDFFFV